MTQLAKRAIDRMAAMQEREHWRATHSDAFKRAANAEIAAGREQSLLERLDGFRRAPRLVIHLRQIQIQLRVIAFHADRFAAQILSIAEAAFRHGCEQSGIRKVERIFRRYA